MCVLLFYSVHGAKLLFFQLPRMFFCAFLSVFPIFSISPYHSNLPNLSHPAQKKTIKKPRPFHNERSSNYKENIAQFLIQLCLIITSFNILCVVFNVNQILSDDVLFYAYFAILNTEEAVISTTIENCECFICRYFGIIFSVFQYITIIIIA